MIERQVLVAGEPVPTGPDGDAWTLTWLDPVHGVALLRRGADRVLVAIDGGPATWTVTLRGRPIPVVVEGHRDRLLAETAGLAASHHGPSEVRATLPGLVVRVTAEPGVTVAAGDPLVTIEAMKMQNEIRATRAGRVSEVVVGPGETVTSGAVLVRLADLDP